MFLQRFQSFCEKMNHIGQKNYEQNCCAFVCSFCFFIILVFVFVNWCIIIMVFVSVFFLNLVIAFTFVRSFVLYLYCKRIVASGSTWTMEEESECEEVEEVVPASGSHLVKT